MKAAIYREFQGPISIEEVPDPSPPSGGVVLRVRATGLCRSDWHGWMGHDSDVRVPHVPGHELAGEIVEVGKGVKNWKIGDRVTLPFVCGCGSCPQCLSGNQQVCDFQFQPGFTHWGSFAEFVSIHYADQNLVRLPNSLPFSEAASLGCRFITSFRAVVHQGKLGPGQWIAVHGCGGVGLSALLIAHAIGARSIAVDIQPQALEFAKRMGAEICIHASNRSVVKQIRELTDGGVHVSIDALGSRETCYNSIACLRKRGKHIQVGLMAGVHAEPIIPMSQVIAHELEILGSHGMQAHVFPDIWNLWEQGRINFTTLLGNTLTLEQVPQALTEMNSFSDPGVRTIQFL
ncbi:MAG: zinc-dependent alcohol dehydrogenase family protein [Bacteroidota bacterium]